MTSSPALVGAVFGVLVAPAALGISATAVALPALGRALGLSTPQTAWVLATYVLAQAVATPVLGRVADRTGTRRVLLVGLLAAVAGSLVAASAQTFAVLVAGRAVQGLGVGAVGIAAFATLSLRLEAGTRARALGAMTAVVGVVSGAGTLIGGALTQYVGWRWAIALPAMTVLAAVPALRLASRPPPTRPGPRFDVLGAAAVSVVVVGGLVLLQARSTGLGPVAVALVSAAAVLALGVAVRTAATRPEGFLPRPVIRSRAFGLGSLAGASLFAGYLALLFAAPRLLGVGGERSSFEVGLVLLPAAAVAPVIAQVVPRVAARTGTWPLVTGAGIASTVGLLLAAGLGDRAPVVVTSLTLVICGFIAAQVALSAELPSLVPGSARAAATGIFQLVFLVGGATGSALAGALSDLTTLPTALALIAAVPLVGAGCATVAGLAARQEHGPSRLPTVVRGRGA